VGLVSEATARDVPGGDGRAERRAGRAQRAGQIREQVAGHGGPTSGEYRGLVQEVRALKEQMAAYEEAWGLLADGAAPPERQRHLRVVRNRRDAG
jgi:hypothetical protein